MSNKKNNSEESTSEIPERKKKALSLALKILLGLLFTFITLIALLLIVPPLYFSPSKVENLLQTEFQKQTTGTLTLRVNSFNPYKGFEVSDVIVRNGTKFNNSTIFTAEKIVFKYNFFSILLGKIYLKPVKIIKPRIFIEENSHGWSYALLIPEKVKKPKKVAKGKKGTPPARKSKIRKKEKIEKKAPDESIDLPIAVEMSIDFLLEDLRIYVSRPKEKTTLEGFTTSLTLEIPPFKQIPKAINALQLIKQLQLKVNPHGTMNVSHYSRTLKTNPQLTFKWNVDFTSSDKVFASSLKFGTKNTPVRFKRKLLAPLQFLLSYDIQYNPFKDLLSLNELAFSFKDRTLFSLSGSVTRVQSNPYVKIFMKESVINLKNFYPYYLSLTGDNKTTFSGDLSLFPFSVTGTPEDMVIHGRLSTKNLFFKNPLAQISIKKSSTDINIIKKNSGVQLSLESQVNPFSYSLKKERAPYQYLSIHTDLFAAPNGKSITINDLQISLRKNKSSQESLKLHAASTLDTSKGMQGSLKLKKLYLHFTRLKNLLPRSVAKKLKAVPIKNSVTIKTTASLNQQTASTNAIVALLATVPEYKIKALSLKGNIEQNTRRKTISIKHFSINSPSLNLGASMQGWIEQKKNPLSNANVALSLSYNNPTPLTVYKGWTLHGNSRISCNFKGNLKQGSAKGNIYFKDFNIFNKKKKMEIIDFSMNFPIAVDIEQKGTGKSILALGKSSVIDNKHFQRENNFNIKSIKGPHPARKTMFEYLTNLSGHISFKENIFSIKNLRCTLMDGSIYGRSIQANLADLSIGQLQRSKEPPLDRIEYRLNLDVTNLNVGLLDEPDRTKVSKNSELSFNANIQGRGVNPKRKINAKGYVNIYEIGDKFANRLMKGLSKEKGKSKLGIVQPILDNFTLPKEFNFNLDKGSVYTRVKFKRKIIGTLLFIEKGEVAYDRLPIQEYLRRVRKEE